MLDKDIKLIENIVIKYTSLDCGLGAWNRIKKFIEEAQNTSTNKPKPQLPADIKEKFRQWCDEQTSFPSEFVQIVNEYFWDLL